MIKESFPWLLLTIIATSTIITSAYNEEQLEKDEIIDAVNKANISWKARRNFHPSLTTDYYKVLLGLIRDPNGTRLPELEEDEDDDVVIPESFDSREHWKECVGLQSVRDQGQCGSCWAVSSTSVFQDRLCIASKGRFNSLLSAQNLLSCCETCGLGCDGGNTESAFEYFETHGIVSGGDYNSSQGCQPYTLPHCDHHVTHGKYKPCGSTLLPTPKCQKKCYNKKYSKISYDEDLHRARKLSSFVITNNVKKAQREILKNGPLVADFEVYEDILSYTDGVYFHHKGEFKGKHAVELIGWGEEDNTPYWLVANSWNEDWGNKGYFKIRRGTNECNFENSMVGGLPDVSDNL